MFFLLFKSGTGRDERAHLADPELAPECNPCPPLSYPLVIPPTLIDTYGGAELVTTESTPSVALQLAAFLGWSVGDCESFTRKKVWWIFQFCCCRCLG